MQSVDAQPLAPTLRFVTQLCVEVAPAIEIGEVSGTRRRVIAITGGTFAGPEISGEVLAGGADWQYTRPDGVSVLEARYTLKTSKGEFISVLNHGFRHASLEVTRQLASGADVARSQYYFMTTPLFETAAPALQWLTRTVFVGHAVRQAARVIVNVWMVEDESALKRQNKSNTL